MLMKIEIDYNGSIAKVRIDGKYFSQLSGMKRSQVITGLKAVLKNLEKDFIYPF